MTNVTHFDAVLAYIKRYLDMGCTDYEAMRRDLNEKGANLSLMPAEEAARKELASKLRSLNEGHDGVNSPISYIRFDEATSTTEHSPEAEETRAMEAVGVTPVDSQDQADSVMQATQIAPPVVHAGTYSDDALASQESEIDLSSGNEAAHDDQARAKSEFPAVRAEVNIDSPTENEVTEPEAELDRPLSRVEAFSESSDETDAVTEARNDQRDISKTHTGTMPTTYEIRLETLKQDLERYEGLPFDFNGRLRDLDSIHDPQQTLSAALYELFVQTRQKLVTLRQRAFDTVRADADAVYLDPHYSLAEKIEKLDYAVNPQWAIPEDAGYASLIQRKEALATTDWTNEERVTKALEYIEYGLQAEYDDPQVQAAWLKEQEGTVDGVIAASALPMALVTRARTAKETIATLRNDISRATNQASSRTADRDYLTALTELESQRGRVKAIYDVITLKTWPLDQLIEQIEFEYADYARTNGKNKLQEALGNETLVKEILSAAFQAVEARAPYQYTGSIKSDASLEAIESSLELGLVHLMPQEYPELPTKYKIAADRSRNPRRQGLAHDADAQREFDGLRAALPVLLQYVRDLRHVRATDKSLGGLLKVYEAWQSQEILRALDNAVQQDWGRVDAIWKSFKDEWERGDLWLLYADEESFEHRLTTIETMLDESPVSRVSVSEAHPYAGRLQTHKDRFAKLKDTVALIRNGRVFVRTETASLNTALESIRRQLGGNTPVPRLKALLEGLHERVDALDESPYFYPADDLRQTITALRIEADQKTGDVELIAELAVTLESIYRDATRRDDVAEWASLKTRAEERFKNPPEDGQTDAASGYVLYLFTAARAGLLQARNTPGTDEGFRDRSEFLTGVQTFVQSLATFLKRTKEDVWQKTRIQRRWHEDLLRDIEREVEAAENAKTYRGKIDEFRRERRKKSDQQRRSHPLPDLLAYAEIAKIIRREIDTSDDPNYRRTLETYLFDEFRKEWDAALLQAVQAFLGEQKPRNQKRRVIRDGYETASQVGVQLTESVKKEQAFRDKSRELVTGRYDEMMKADDPKRVPEALFDLLRPLEVNDYEELFLQAQQDAQDNPISQNIKNESVAAAYYLLALAETDSETGQQASGDVGRQAIMGYLAQIFQTTPILAQNLPSQALSSVQRHGTAYMLRDGYLMSYWFTAKTMRINSKPGSFTPEQRLEAEQQANLLSSPDLDINRIGQMWKKRLSIIHAAVDGLTGQALALIGTFKEEYDPHRTIEAPWVRRRHREMGKSIGDLEIEISGCGGDVHIDATPESYLQALEQAIRCWEMGAKEEADRLFKRLLNDTRLKDVDRLLHNKLKLLIEQTLDESLLRAYADIVLLSDQVRTLAHGLNKLVEELKLSLQFVQNLSGLETRLKSVTDELKIACEQYESGHEQLTNVILNQGAANDSDNWKLTQVSIALGIILAKVGSAVTNSANDWPYKDDDALTAPQNFKPYGKVDLEILEAAFGLMQRNISEIQNRIEFIRTDLQNENVSNPRTSYNILGEKVEEIHDLVSETNEELQRLKFNRPNTPVFPIPDAFFKTAPARNMSDLTLYVPLAVERDAGIRDIFTTTQETTPEEVAKQWAHNNRHITQIHGLYNHRVVLGLMRFRVDLWAGFWERLTAAYKSYLVEWADLSKAMAHVDMVENTIRQLHNITKNDAWPETNELNFSSLANATFEPQIARPSTRHVILSGIQRLESADDQLRKCANGMTEIGGNLNISRDLYTLRDGAANAMAQLETVYDKHFTSRLSDSLRRSISTDPLRTEVDKWLQARNQSITELKASLHQFQVYCDMMQETLRNLHIPEPSLFPGSKQARREALETRFLLERSMWLLLDDAYNNEPTRQL